jgi:hypothetical protein
VNGAEVRNVFPRTLVAETWGPEGQPTTAPVPPPAIVPRRLADAHADGTPTPTGTPTVAPGPMLAPTSSPVPAATPPPVPVTPTAVPSPASPVTAPPR